MAIKTTSKTLVLKLFTSRALQSDRLKKYVHRRFTSTLARFRESIKEIKVWLIDLNGPKKAIDKHCISNVVLRNGEILVAHSEDSNLYRAIDEACKKSKHLLSKKIRGKL